VSPAVPKERAPRASSQARAKATPRAKAAPIDPGVLTSVLMLPVRHHSPRAAAFVRAELDRARPAVVLIEGPGDTGALIPALVDGETRPPVAILGYRTDGATQSVLWPFAAYSPEYVALVWAAEHGVPARFIDIDVGTALAMAVARRRVDPDGAGIPGGVLPVRGDGNGHGDGNGDGHGDGDGDGHGDGDRDRDRHGDGHLPIDARIAGRVGLRHFDEAWDALVEAPAHGADDVRALLLAYADLLRAERDRDDRGREAVMARHIAAAAAEHGAANVAVLVGAAHAAAFLAGDVDPDAEAELPAPAACASTVIPYSFPRLSEQLGYGAGNRAPRFYQRAHDAGGDLGRASLETLIDLGEHLRLRGFAVSLADALEAWRLAVMLAQIRGKVAPTLDEVREAATATLGRGDGRIVDDALTSAAIGHAVGRVTAKVAPSSLAEEFWREVRARRLPASDRAEDFALTLNDDVQIATSVFLHRLRVATIPYAAFAGAGRGRRGPGLDDEVGGLAALGRVREQWTAQWTPATDVALVEAIVLGSSLEEVTGRILDRRLAAARTTGEHADVLLEAVVTVCPDLVGRALAACDASAAHDDDLPSLARASAALSSLVSYGTSRGGPAVAGAAVADLLATTFDRAVLRLPAAAAASGDGIRPVLTALRALHEVALAQPLVDRDAWLAAARATSADFAIAPEAAGLATGLLYLAQAMSDDEVATAVALRLSAGNPPEAAAGFLGGFLQVNALVLVKSRPVVAALDAYLCAIPAESFRDALPVLRRALGDLGATERRYLVENVIAIRGIGEAARAAARVIDEKDRDALRALDADLAGALGDLDDLL
jgi:hypothetical protein